MAFSFFIEKNETVTFYSAHFFEDVSDLLKQGLHYSSHVYCHLVYYEWFKYSSNLSWPIHTVLYQLCGLFKLQDG